MCNALSLLRVLAASLPMALVVGYGHPFLKQHLGEYAEECTYKSRIKL